MNLIFKMAKKAKLNNKHQIIKQINQLNKKIKSSVTAIERNSYSKVIVKNQSNESIVDSSQLKDQNRVRFYSLK